MGNTVKQDSSAQGSRVVTRGFLEEFGAIPVLQALSLSRQYTAVELFTKDGKSAGRVTLKSGMVLEATKAGSSLVGSQAFQELVASELHSFQVERLPTPASFPEPIGQLLAELRAVRPAHIKIAPEPPSDADAPEPSEQPTTRVESIQDVAIRESQRPPSVRKVSGPAPSPASLRAAESPTTKQAPSPSGGGPVIVGVASPKGGCGKTTIALNLAVSLARSGLRVLLVDADPNGDVLSALGNRERAKRGVYDVLNDDVETQTMVIETAVPGLAVVPAMGQELAPSLWETASVGAWKRTLQRLGRRDDVVLVDLPAGMFGPSAEILSACTHVLGVLQADVIPKRSFEMFRRALDANPDMPRVMGVVLNMFERSHAPSVSVLVEAGDIVPPEWLLETTIPRNHVFSHACDQGMPVSFSHTDAARTIGVLFDAVAAEFRTRLCLDSSTQSSLKSFLL